MTEVIAPDFDWKHPDYPAIFRQRLEALKRIREDSSKLPALKAFYKDNPAQFIMDWGCTFDPRNVEIGLPSVIPFVLFPRQIEWINWVMDSWRKRRPGVSPKSRESGVSWLAVGLACSLGLFHEGLVIGFGSYKVEYVDLLGAPKSLFWKARRFLNLLPVEFRGSFDDKNDAPHMRIMLKDTGSVLTGEGGDGIGRGDRAAIYFVDEAAHLERPEDVDAALSQTTNCRIDVSTAHGLNNPFHHKVMNWPAERVFRFHWRDDPRKDDAWYAKQLDELDPVTIAQEIDIDFAASVEGVLIPSAWVQSAVGAADLLGIVPTGDKFGALDVADEGRDLLCFCGAYGISVDVIEEWSGKGDDIFGSVVKTFDLCDANDYSMFRYDADGLGAGVRGDARVLNDTRRKEARKQIKVESFRGSAGVVDPEAEDVKGRKNKDYFANAKAQSWWSLRTRFQRTHRAVEAFRKSGSRDFDADSLISISPKMPTKVRGKLEEELSQPVYGLTPAGKVTVDKQPDGKRSPNKADSVMIRFARAEVVMEISAEVLQRSRRLAGSTPRRTSLQMIGSRR